MAVRAPELAGRGGWIGVEDLSLAALRGRCVLLHFWTLGCINCVRVTEELRGLERRFAGVLEVVGIHSPKFAHEHDHGAVRAAVARMRVSHPVLDDPDLVTWDAYAVRAWPTLVLVDPAGYVALHVTGEGHTVALAREIERLARAVDPVPGVRAEAPPPGPDELAFPGKVAAAGDGRIAIADTGHDRVLLATADGDVLEEIGGLYQPQGVAFEPGGGLLVCETGADRVWRIADGRRTVILDGVASPWDVARWHGHVVVAEAGRHRLWAIDADGEPQVVAGSGAEGLVDGPALAAQLAQPSGLAVTADGALAFADAEASALRVLDRPGGEVRTLVGAGLFDWGAADGDARRARLQHPLGVAAGADGALWVADTYNGLLRVLRGTHLWTVPVEGFAEPGGVAVLPGGDVLVADTAHHRVVRVDPVAARAHALALGAAPVGAVPPLLALRAGDALEVELDVPLAGDVLDAAAGPPVEVRATATDPGLLDAPLAWRFDALPARVAVPLGAGSGRVTVELRVATCDARACRLRRTERAWDVVVSP